MSRKNLAALSVAELVEAYAATGIEEDKAEMEDDLPRRKRGHYGGHAVRDAEP